MWCNKPNKPLVNNPINYIILTQNSRVPIFACRRRKNFSISGNNGGQWVIIKLAKEILSKYAKLNSTIPTMKPGNTE